MSHMMCKIRPALDMSQVAQWIPGPFNLLERNPFEYSQHTISSIPGTEAFETSIKTRDRRLCVVCGSSQQQGLNYCHIIPKVEDDTVRFELMFYHIRTDHGTVGGNAGHWFCALNGKGCGA
jgi:hypothetical protein